jgi:DNA (cytosine-5)-methyltransferase 1
MEGSVVVLNEVFATLRSGGDGGVPSSRGEHLVAEEDTVRRLTPVECERLQGFPDDWTAIHTDTHRYKQMGNAVTVNVLRWIGGRL